MPHLHLKHVARIQVVFTCMHLIACRRLHVSCISATKLPLRRYVSTCIRIQVARPGYLYPATCIWCKRGFSLVGRRFRSDILIMFSKTMCNGRDIVTNDNLAASNNLPAARNTCIWLPAETTDCVAATVSLEIAVTALYRAVSCRCNVLKSCSISTRFTPVELQHRRMFCDCSLMQRVAGICCFLEKALDLTSCSTLRPVSNTRRIAIANGTCVSFCSQSKAHFGLPWVRPWDNRGKCYMDGKRIQCWSNA